MDISAFFKSLADSDIAPIVICNFENTIIYMNPTAISRYEKWGGEKLVGKSIFCCHNNDSNKKIVNIVKWFAESKDNNRMFTYHNPDENKDVYMIALRNETGKLIGYYEKHEYRNPEKQ